MSDPDSDLELLSDLAVACVGGHTRVAFARHVAEALASHSRLRRLEVAWSTEHEASAIEVVPARGAWRVAHEGPPRAAARIAEAVATGRPVTRPGRARQATLALPLFEDGVPVGAVVLSLTSPEPRWSRHALLRAVGAVLLAGHRACRTIERVAAASLRAHQDYASLRRRLDAEGAVDVVARSAAMLDALRRADLAASHEVTVLLRGESGTGKGVLARRIHARSPRASGPFVHVDCAALPEALVESELFGHEVGAFTGATRRHVGKVERAAGGTLFLDEVGELPAPAQAKLLRLLQDGTFERVGGERELRARARIVAATHRPLERMVTKGRWRADLYHRLAVFPITVPPLRARPDDVPALVDAALARAATRLSGRVRPRMASDALARLVRHEWPGNVRELENLVERAAILAGGEPIDARVLADAGLGAAPARPRGDQVDDDSERGEVMTLEAATRAALVRALRAAEGRIYGARGAAALLGLRPSTLQTKMIAHGLRRAAFVPRE